MQSREAADTEINFLVSPKQALFGFIQSFNKHLVSIYYKLGSVLGSWMTRWGLHFEDTLRCVQI